MRGFTFAGAALAAALLAPPGLAEVRLVETAPDGTLSVDILSTPRGPWTPTGSVTAQVLNPSGDLFGDTMPGWDARGPSVLSAWIRPGSGVLYRSLGFAPGWSPVAPILSPGAYGQPVVDTLTGGWSVTWQQSLGLDAQRILVTGTLPDGRAVDPIVAADGTLVGTSPNGNYLFVVSVDRAGYMWSTTIAFAFVPTQPIPIQLSIVGRTQLGRGPGGGGFMGGGGSLGGAGGSGSLSDAAGSDVLAQVDPRVIDIVGRDGEPSVLVTWWSEPGVLNAVEVGDDGPRLPASSLTANGSDRHPERLVDRAIRQAERD